MVKEVLADTLLLFAGIIQGLECLVANENVVGSNPTVRFIEGGLLPDERSNRSRTRHRSLDPVDNRCDRAPFSH